MPALIPLEVRTFDGRDGNHYRVYKVRTVSTSDTLDIETAIPSTDYSQIIGPAGGLTITASTTPVASLTITATASVEIRILVWYPGLNTSI